MILLYYYSKQIELNISNQYNFKFDKDKEFLTVKKLKKTLPKGFWGDDRIKNVSVVVGDNGIGKTRVYSSNIIRNYRNRNVIRIFKDYSNDLIAEYYTEDFPKFNSNFSFVENDLSIHETIFYSNELGLNSISLQPDYNLSSKFILESKIKSDKKHRYKADSLNNYFIDEVFKQVNFFENEAFNEIHNEINPRKELFFTWKSSVNKQTINQVNNSELVQSISGENNLLKRFIFNLYLQYYEPNNLSFTSKEKFDSIKFDQIIGEYNSLSELYNFFETNKSMFVSLSQGSSKKELEDNYTLYFELNNVRNLFKLLSNIKDFDFKKSYFNWGLSAGENSLCSIFSRFNYLVENEKLSENLIIVFDEGNEFFHPEWSRKFVYYILTYLPKILYKAKSLQFVFTTHSPFILSDMPTECIFKLVKNNENKYFTTRYPFNGFCQNILKIYDKGLFMENGFIGEFAKQKIENLIKYLRNDENPDLYWNQQIAKETIEIVGDENIKYQLYQLFETKFSNDSDKKKRIKELEAELKRLRNEED